MSYKTTLAIFIAFVMLFAGIGYAKGADSVIMAPNGKVQGYTKIDPSKKATITEPNGRKVGTIVPNGSGTAVIKDSSGRVTGYIKERN